MKLLEEDIVLVYKPYGLTSFGVIKLMRKRLQNKKIGHAGTLDPLAEGLMILGIGSGTKKIMSYMKLDKEYIFDVLLGISTDTDDLEGNIVSNELKVIEKDKIYKVIASLQGERELHVPAFSAIKLKGERLYKIARKDKNFLETPKKLMQIQKIEVLNIEDSTKYKKVKVKATVSSGTYIRSISKEIGNMLGIPSTISKLVRTKIDNYDLSQLEIEDDLNWFSKNIGGTKIIQPKKETVNNIL